jgi:putative membrane protein
MLWVMAFHIIFVITWFAGLFYLPRLYVYHAMSEDEISNQRFKIMERKLYWGIMTPSAVLVLLSGLWLVLSYAWQTYSKFWWLDIKLALVALLFIYHGMCHKYMLDFKTDKNTKSHIYYRWFNEVPALLLILIIILVVVKPF